MEHLLARYLKILPLFWLAQGAGEGGGDVPEKQSILDAIEHLLAKYLEILPLFFAPARPMKVEWNIRPYFGVFPFVFRALKTNKTKSACPMG